MDEWWIGDTTRRAPGAELDSLRRAVAELLGTDQETWPAHGNVPLAIASAIARFKIERDQALADLDLANARVAEVEAWNRHWEKAANDANAELARVRADFGWETAHAANLQAQLDRVDDVLGWKYTGRGRVESVELLQARVAVLRDAFGNNATRLHGPIHVGGHVPLDWRIATCDLCAILANSDDAAKALFDRARAAGVEVTGHE